MEHNQLQTILDQHAKWIKSGDTAGERAALRGADLRGAGLQETTAFVAGQDVRGYLFVAKF